MPEHGKIELSKLIHVTNNSRLAPTLDNLRYTTDPTTIPAIWFRNTEDECDIAVNPTNPDNIIVVTHQDRFTNFLTDIAVYSLDGGKTWNESSILLSRNQGATIEAAANDYESASDPHVIFDKEGNAYVISVSFNTDNNFEEAVVVAKSTDGGVTWNMLTEIQRDDGNEHFQDYQHITADPYRKNTLYTVWSDDTALLGLDPNSTIFQKSTDGGATWSPLSNIATYPGPTPDYGPLSSQLVVFPGHHHHLAVANFVSDQTASLTSTTPAKVTLLRSKDDGLSWTEYLVADNIPLVTPTDPVTGRLILAGGTSVNIAVNNHNGKIYATWPDPRYNTNNGPGIVVAMSKDEGQTWSTPVPVNPKNLGAQTFLSAITVLHNGLVGVTFYDLRNYTGDGPLWTDVWMAIFDEDLKHRVKEVRMTDESFDTRQAMIRIPFNNAWFLGDYTGLTAHHNTFYACFAITNPPYGAPPVEIPVTEFRIDNRDGEDFPNRQDVVFRKVHVDGKDFKHKYSLRKFYDDDSSSEEDSEEHSRGIQQSNTRVIPKKTNNSSENPHGKFAGKRS